jgi:site-specific DNA-methyltransferase (cytosine-N4-specific)
MGMASWAKNNGGAIPPNLLQFPNCESNGQYLRYCKAIGLKGHPARFPASLPEFFIKFLTDEEDVVIDIFSGSNTTGLTAEKLNRKWKSFELSQEYVANSALRFASSEEEAQTFYSAIQNGDFIKIEC